MEELVLILWGFHKKHLHHLTIDEVKNFEADIFKFASDRNPDLIKAMRDRKKIDDEIEKGLEDVLLAYMKKVKPKLKLGASEDEKDAIVAKIGAKVMQEAAGKGKK